MRSVRCEPPLGADDIAAWTPPADEPPKALALVDLLRLLR